MAESPSSFGPLLDGLALYIGDGSQAGMPVLRRALSTFAGQASEHPDELGLAAWSQVELIEAAVRAGQPGQAADALRSLSEISSASGTDWALGVEARSRALLSEGEAAEGGYRAAIQRLGQTRVRLDLARAHLLYGEWLRRENRRIDAREQLRRAHQMLQAMGAEGFAERARRELMAAGQAVRKRTAAAAGGLTAQEQQIALRAREGRTNAEIGAELFLSPRTVEWHMGNVFIKLGITSRGQLWHVLGGDAAIAVPLHGPSVPGPSLTACSARRQYVQNTMLQPSAAAWAWV
jgi:DNA-binding CsgD family transcriptional regulator